MPGVKAQCGQGHGPGRTLAYKPGFGSKGVILLSQSQGQAGFLPTLQNQGVGLGRVVIPRLLKRQAKIFFRGGTQAAENMQARIHAAAAQKGVGHMGGRVCVVG